MKSAIKKVISILLVAVMVFGAAPLAGFVGLELNLFTFNANAEESATGGTCGQNLTWVYDDATGELVISGTGSMSFLTAPWMDYRSSITSVILGDGVTCIDDYAFINCKSLEKITIPDSVTGIGSNAFLSCASLESIILGNSVTFIGSYAFSMCVSLMKITFPDSLTTIGDSAFSNCSSLKNLTIPAGVTNIGNSAFTGCESLKSITVAPGNTDYSTDKNGVLFNKDQTVLICYPKGSSLRNYEIPDTVKIINDNAFGSIPLSLSLNTNLKSVTIPDSVTSIGSYAFACCAGLTSITIPDSVTSIGEYAFYLCAYLENAKIGKGITSLKTFAFAGCYLLNSIVIPETVKSISAYAFFCDTELKDIYYGASKSEWEQITVGANNNPLYSAKVHYNSAGPVGGSAEVPDNTPDYDSSVTDIYLMPTPTQTTISYGDSIILHVDPSKIPKGGYAEWYPSNGNFSYSVSADGTTCTITPEKSGNTKFTALIYDAEGNIVSADEQIMISKAGLFDKIIAFFKKLFGATEIIPQGFKFIF